MRYQLPSLADMQLAISKLKQYYQGENKVHLNYITLLEYVSKETQLIERLPQYAKFAAPEDARKILLGALIFIQESITKEYKIFSPEKREGWVFNTGSDLYTDLQSILKVSPDNLLHDDERLIYLLKFYKYVDNVLPEATATSVYYKTKKKLLEEVNFFLKQSKEKIFGRMKFIVEGPPCLSVLQKKITFMPEKYEKDTATRWFKNNKRKDLLQFISLIEQTCHDCYPEGSLVAKDGYFTNDVNYITARNIRLGAILFTAMTIKDEYKYRSPKNSELFMLCLQALNVNDWSEIKREEKILWLEELFMHLQKIKNNHQYYKTLGDTWEKKGFKQLENFYHAIDAYVSEQRVKRDTPSWTQTTANYAVQYGIGFLATQWLAEIAVPAVGGLVTGLTGPIGLAIYFGGTILMTQLGRLVHGGAVHYIAAYMWAWMLDRFGSAVVSTATGVLTYTLTREGMRDFLNNSAITSEDRIFVMELVDTLLELPSNILSDDDKEHIRNVFGIEEKIESQFVMAY